jgi:hypothetical protein
MPTVLNSAFCPIDIASGVAEYVAMLHVCLDDNETLRSEEPTIAFAGLISDIGSWHSFQGEWKKFLRRSEIPHLHTKDLMRPFPYFEKYDSPETKLRLLEDAAAIIQKYCLAAIACAVDRSAFASVQKVREKYSNPKFFCFQGTIKCLVDSLMELDRLEGIGETHPAGLIFDDSEEYSVECYKLLSKTKFRNQEWRKRIGSICFVDDELYVSLQAADMFAWLCAKRFHGNHDHDSVWEILTRNRLCFDALYDRSSLEKLARVI